jgi:hypothetical protein
MSVIITNVSKHDDVSGPNDYVLRVNHREIARFTHVRKLGLAECLRRAAEAAENADRDRVLRLASAVVEDRA